MKYEWRKKEKDLYIPKEVPTVIDVPKFKYLTIEGIGNPNESAFQERIATLYPLAYAIRMMPKNGYTPKDYYEYTVYPLEGIWSLTEKGIKEQLESGTLNKNELKYKLMLRQPDFVNDDVVKRAFEAVRKKSGNPLLDLVNFEEIEDGLSLQMLHIGPYDDEVKTFNKMKEYIDVNGYERLSLDHREIYLSDFRKVSPDKLKTTLRYSIKKK